MESRSAKWFLYGYNTGRSPELSEDEYPLYHLWSELNSLYLERHCRDISQFDKRRARGGRWMGYLLLDQDFKLIGYTAGQPSCLLSRSCHGVIRLGFFDHGYERGGLHVAASFQKNRIFQQQSVDALKRYQRDHAFFRIRYLFQAACYMCADEQTGEPVSQFSGTVRRQFHAILWRTIIQKRPPIFISILTKPFQQPDPNRDPDWKRSRQ